MIKHLLERFKREHPESGSDEPYGHNGSAHDQTESAEALARQAERARRRLDGLERNLPY